MPVNVGTAVGYLDLDTSKFQRGFKDAQSALSGFAGNADKTNGIFSKIGSAATKAATVAVTGVTAVATAVGVMAKKATDSYGSYEQLTGGIETLFGAQGMSLKEYASSVGKTVGEVKEKYNILQNAQSTAMKNAGDAYKTAGLSMNDYMETVTSFAASLKQSVSNEEEAAKSANQAVIDMADNANKMGSSMESIQNAYQGFAKQNYTMLDNLKLGYGGTKEEMQRLLADAEKISGIKYDISNLNDVYSAIHVVQTELGITGTTAKEASTTIEGSANMMKASWENLLTGLGNKEANLNTLIDQFVESTKTYINNMLPVFTQVVSGIGKLVEGLAPMIGEELPKLIKALLPSLLKASVSLISSLVSALPQLLESLYSAIKQTIKEIGTMINEQAPSIGDMLTKFTDIGAKMMDKIGTGFKDNFPKLVEKAYEVIEKLVDSFVKNGPKLIQSGLEMIKNIAKGIADSLPIIAEKAPEIIAKIVVTLVSCLPDIIEAGIEIIVALVKGIVKAIPKLAESVPKMIKAIVDAIYDAKSRLREMGTNIVSNIIEGIESLLSKLSTTAKKILESIVNSIKELPNKVGEIVGKALGRVANWVLDFTKKGKEGGEKFVKGIEQFLKSLPTNALNWLNKTITNAVKFAKEFPTKAKQAAKDFSDMLINGVKQLPSQMLNIGKQIIDGIVNGIKNSWNNAKNTVNSFAKGIVDGFKSALSIHSPSKVMKDQVGAQIANGVIEGVKSRKDEAKKTASQLSQDIVEAAEKKLDVLQTYNQISVEQEVQYWKTVLDSTTKGTDANLKAYKNYKQALEDVDANILSSAETKLDKLQTYNKISIGEEYLYWKEVTSQLSKGSDEYLKAYKNMIAAKKEYNQELKDLETEYKDKVKQVYDDLETKVSSLTKAYNDQVKARKQVLLSQFNVFDVYDVDLEKSSEDLLYALQSQVGALSIYNKQMEELEGRSILPKSLLDALKELGVDATGELIALNQMTDEQLKQYGALWKERNRIASEEAKRESEQAYEKLQSDIEKANLKAYEKLDKLDAKYQKKISEMKSQVYKETTVVGQKTVTGIISGIKSKSNALENSLITIMNTVDTYASKINSKLNKVKSDYNQLTILHTHRSGLSYVPYDGYRTVLHEGEKVLTKEEAKQQNNGGDTFIFNSPKAIDEKEAARQIKRTKQQLALDY